jgi:hypothetical protein
MGFIRSVPGASGARVMLGTWIAIVALTLAAVAPVDAARTPLRLAEASVSDRTLEPGASALFRVTYKNSSGARATLVAVDVGDGRHVLAPSRLRRNERGVFVYEARIAPPPGAWRVTFVAADSAGNRASLTSGTVTVAAAEPGSESGGIDGGSTDGATTPGTGSGSPDGGSTDGATTGGTGSGSPDGGSADGATPDGSGSGSPDGATTGGTGGGSTGAAPDATVALPADPGPRIGDPDDAIAPDRPSTHERSTEPATTAPEPGTTAWAGDEPVTDAAVGRTIPDGVAMAGIAAALPGILTGPLDPIAILLPTLVTTTGGVAMAMAFLAFGKRRRDGRPTDSDMALAAAAATGLHTVPAADLAPTAVLGTRDAPSRLEGELAMPRWRRPSLLEARKADPARVAAPEVPRLTFGGGGTEASEVRQIRYRVVRLLDSPDELVASEVGALDQGDEVRLLERSGVYWLVEAPDGQRGWLHRMVLAEVDDVAMPGPAARATAARAAEDLTATRMATAAMRPADVGLEVDDDVLSAFAAARSRLGA